MSLVSIFWVTRGKVMRTRGTPDFWGLYKDNYCAFPLKHFLSSTSVFKRREAGGPRLQTPLKESTHLNLQLEISVISKENVWIHPVFFLTWFSLRAKTFQAHICRKETLLPVCKKDAFFINIKKIDKWFITCNRTQLWGTRTLSKGNLKNKLVNKKFLKGSPRCLQSLTPQHLKLQLLCLQEICHIGNHFI